MTYRFLILCCSILFIGGHTQSLLAQDTLKVNLVEFIDRAINNSGEVSYQSHEIDLAQNRVQQAREKRILPEVRLDTQHGIVPGVVSQRDELDKGEFYLDPNLSNDWENWAVFTRAEMRAVQPIYSWGAVNSAIQAAEAGARAAEYRFSAVENEAKIRLFELYYSYLLSIEIDRILEDAENQLERVDERVQEMREEGNPDLEESDVFKLEIYKSEFQTRKVEVQQSMDYIRRVWSYALQAEDGEVFMPDANFLDPVPYELREYEYYRDQAMNSRPELKGVESGITAMKSRIDAIRAEQYPIFYLGITGSFAHTPNRPRQTNPFIINNTNYLSAGFGFGIRQNLNLFALRNSIDRAEIEYKQTQDLERALSDQIVLELNDRYREAVIADSKVKQTDEALVTARRWVRNEQLNYDIGFGNVEDLLDAVQKELELRVQLKQNIFDLNKKIAALHKAGGLPFVELNAN
jgi:outer membrane protein TolC